VKVQWPTWGGWGWCESDAVLRVGDERTPPSARLLSPADMCAWRGALCSVVEARGLQHGHAVAQGGGVSARGARAAGRMQALAPAGACESQGCWEACCGTGRGSASAGLSSASTGRNRQHNCFASALV
jgi:hypothetical protein